MSYVEVVRHRRTNKLKKLGEKIQCKLILIFLCNILFIENVKQNRISEPSLGIAYYPPLIIRQELFHHMLSLSLSC